MNKELLYRFFEGNASVNEEKQIKQWLDASEANHRVFFQERKVYDAILLTIRGTSLKQKRKVLLSPWATGAAAAIALLLIVSGLYLLIGKDSTGPYNTLFVPPGQRINLILADNSNVWLNSNTEFRYPSSFSKKNRT